MFDIANKLVKSNDTLQHWGIKGMKWDKKKDPEKESKNTSIKDDGGDNQNAAVQKLKEDLKKSGSGIIKGQTVTDSKKNNKNVKSLDEIVKDEEESIPNKISKKLDELKNSIFKEKTTYRVVGVDKQKVDKVINKSKHKTLTELLPKVFKETTITRSVIGDKNNRPEKPKSKLKVTSTSSGPSHIVEVRGFGK